MKSIKTKLVAAMLCLLTISASFISCSDDDSSGGSPVITNINDAIENEPVTQGYAGDMYIIQGKGFTDVQKIYFNGVDTYFNSTLVTDNNIFVTIDRETPYENASEELTIVTKRGSVTYHFVVAPPAPGIQSFLPVNAVAGQTVTIYGSYFLNPTVTFGGIPAEILTSSLTQLTVKMPEGAFHKYLEVTTISGSDTSWEAVGTAIHDDVWYDGWALEGSTAENLDYADAASGTKSLISTLAGWGSFSTNWIWNDQISAFKGIRFAVKAKNAGQIQVIFNGQWGANFKDVNVSTGWTYVEIPWSDFGNPTQAQSIAIKNNRPDENTFYVDAIGYTLK